MRKVIAGVMMSLDGVMQAPGGPEEDPTERWLGKDALRDLTRPVVAKRAAARDAKRKAAVEKAAKKAAGKKPIAKKAAKKATARR